MVLRCEHHYLFASALSFNTCTLGLIFTASLHTVLYEFVPALYVIEPGSFEIIVTQPQLNLKSYLFS